MHPSLAKTIMDQLSEKIDGLQMGCGKKVYVCMLRGSDETGSGTQEQPFGTLAHAVELYFDKAEEKLPEDVCFILRKTDEDGFQDAPKAALKKAISTVEVQLKKARKAVENKGKGKEKKVETDEQSYVTLEEDSSLPTAQKIRIRDGENFRGKRVMVQGWVHRMRMQGRKMIFLTVRDGTGFLQCVLADEMARSADVPCLTIESTVALYGQLVPVLEGKTAPGGHELQVDYWRLVHAAPSGMDAFETKLNKEANPDVLFDQRHLVLRGETASALLKLRSIFLQAFRAHYAKHNYSELTPPCMTQTQCEGGATLFKLDYYGEPAYLTQSSQLYLETAIPSLGDVYCVQMSFRAEASRTRRHLSEFTHIEAECPFITYDELLERLESLVCDVIQYVLADPYAGPLVRELNPDLVVPQRPFRRMEYGDAIAWLAEHNVLKDDGTAYEHGDDIPERPERFMVDSIGEPIFLCRFPAAMKAFYMERDPKDRSLTLSTDLLMPGVGEIVGGSMRIWDFDELMAGYAREGIDPSAYYWYTDQRKYGSCPHGGYGLGFERFLAWALRRDHVREVCLYPRYVKRCAP